MIDFISVAIWRSLERPQAICLTCGVHVDIDSPLTTREKKDVADRAGDWFAIVDTLRCPQCHRAIQWPWAEFRPSKENQCRQRRSV